MRFQYVDRSGRKVEVQSLEGLAARLELGAITPETMLYDAVADRWAPAAEHEFFRSLVRPAGRETALPVTPPGLVPSPEEVEPVVEGRGAEDDPDPAAVDAPPGSAPGSEDIPAPGASPPEEPEGDASQPDGSDEESMSRGPDPRAQGSFAEIRDGTGSGASALFGLLDLDEGAEVSDPFGGELELDVLPDVEAPPADRERGNDPTAPAADAPVEGPTLDEPLPADILPPPEAPAPPLATRGEGPGPRVLSLDELGAGDDGSGAGSTEEAAGEPAGEGGRESGAREGDWRYVPGGPPPRPLKGVEVPGEEDEPYFRATRSSPATLAGGGDTGRRPADLLPVLRTGGIALVLALVVWFVGARWGPWADPRDRVPAELQAPFGTAWSGAYGDLLQAFDAMGRARPLAERPGRDWLEGVYLAYASRYPAEGEYWSGLGALVRDFRLSEDSIFASRVRSRLEAQRLPDGDRELLLREALRRFEESRPARVRVYAQAEGIAAAAAELHGLLVQHEEEILYEPFTVSGVSRDPVIEAVPTNRPLAETMWSLIDRVTRGLQDMDAIMGVSTRGFVDAVLRALRNADPTLNPLPGSPAPGG